MYQNGSAVAAGACDPIHHSERNLGSRLAQVRVSEALLLCCYTLAWPLLTVNTTYLHI